MNETTAIKTKRVLINICKYALLIFAAFVALVPIVSCIFTAFKSEEEYANTNVITPPKSWLNFDNFITAWNKANMGEAFLNSFIILICVLAGSIMISAMLAYVLNRFKFPGNKLIRNLFTIATLIPGIASQVTVYQIMTALHLVNSMPGYIILMMGTDVITIYIFLQFFENLSPTLDESAILDGCTYFGVFFKILLPLLKPAIVTSAILKGVSTYNEHLRRCHHHHHPRPHRVPAVSGSNLQRHGCRCGERLKSLSTFSPSSSAASPGFCAGSRESVAEKNNNLLLQEFLIMSNVKMFCDALPNIPWQEKPADATGPVWRYSENPIIDRNPVEGVARIFNSAVVPYEGKFIGVFRGEQVDGIPYIYLGRSEDGIHWNFDKDKIPFVNEKGEPFMPVYAYDPRLVKVEDTYYIIWCQDFYGASIGIAKTTDFKTFVRIENPFIPFNRNAVLFPRKINGMYTLLRRPSDSGHTPFGDIFLSQSPDMEFWGRHRHVMSKGSNWWESVKIGGGAAPIETSEGWLLFYHGVTGTCNGFVYSIGGAILDKDEPSKVLYRCGNFLLTPEKWYEERGFVPNVCFPCATLQDADTGRIALYYGCADSYVGLAFTTVDEVVDYIKTHDNAGPTDHEVGIR